MYPYHPTLVHPLTGQPLQALGRRRDGRLIWPVLGGSEDAGGAGSTDTGSAGDGGDSGQAPPSDAGTDSTSATGDGSGDKPADAPKPKAPAPDGTKTSGKQQDAKQDNDTKQGDQESPPSKVEDLPSWAQKLITDLRKGEGDHRVKAKENEAAVKVVEEKHQKLLEGFAKALGITTDEETEEPVDPAKLTAELESARKAHQQVQVELAVYRAAGKHGADGDALLDSRGFLSKVNALDPAAENFGAKVGDAIKKALTDNPKLKAATTAAAPSGGEFAGGPGGSQDPESMSVDDFRKQRKSASS